MLNSFPISLGVTAAKVHGGTGTSQLTTGYTPAIQTRTAGVGNVSHACTVALDGSTATLVRLMDYTDPLNPRALLSTCPADGLGPVIVHTVVVSPGTGQIAAGAFELQGQLGGLYAVTALEVKGTGTLAAGDTFDATGTGLQA